MGIEGYFFWENPGLDRYNPIILPLTMKILSTITLVLFAAIVAPVPEAQAGRVTQNQFRKFKGIYSGGLAGLYGEAVGGLIDLQPTSFPAEVRISSRRKSSVVSGTGRVHTIRYSRPTGTRRRVNIRGIYIGSFFNPLTATSEPVTGGQRIRITDKGRNKRFRFQMRFGDVLQEGSLSYQDVNGVLKKAR